VLLLRGNQNKEREVKMLYSLENYLNAVYLYYATGEKISKEVWLTLAQIGFSFYPNQETYYFCSYDLDLQIAIKFFPDRVEFGYNDFNRDYKTNRGGKYFSPRSQSYKTFYMKKFWKIPYDQFNYFKLMYLLDKVTGDYSTSRQIEKGEFNRNVHNLEENFKDRFECYYRTVLFPNFTYDAKVHTIIVYPCQDVYNLVVVGINGKSNERLFSTEKGALEFLESIDLFRY